MRTSWPTCCATSPTNMLSSGKAAGPARSQHDDIASAQQVGQQVGSMEYINQQVVQQVRVWCTCMTLHVNRVFGYLEITITCLK
jgi:hypothetical protein